MSAAFSIVLDWITSSRGPDVRIPASRAYALAFLLWPETSKFSSLSEIAVACGLTKAAVSKSLLDFKDQSGLTISAGKGHYTRGKFRVAQNAAVAKGSHASNIRTGRQVVGRRGLSNL